MNYIKKVTFYLLIPAIGTSTVQAIGISKKTAFSVVAAAVGAGLLYKLYKNRAAQAPRENIPDDISDTESSVLAQRVIAIDGTSHAQVVTKPKKKVTFDLNPEVITRDQNQPTIVSQKFTWTWDHLLNQLIEYLSDHQADLKLTDEQKALLESVIDDVYTTENPEPLFYAVCVDKSIPLNENLQHTVNLIVELYVHSNKN